MVDAKKIKEEYEDLPGTWVFDADRSRKGYHLNKFFMSLMKEENRKEFLKFRIAHPYPYQVVAFKNGITVNP